MYFFKEFLNLFLAVLGLHCCVGFSLIMASGGHSSHGAQASHCGGFSCCGARALGVQASVAVVHELSSCGTQALDRRLK